jgi:hypothetical protein
MTTLVMTAVDTWWEHFISLRDHYMAQDEVQEAAALFTTLYVMSEPDVLAEGDWHLPFVTEAERYTTPLGTQIMLSVARCARTSYASDHATMLLAATTRSATGRHRPVQASAATATRARWSQRAPSIGTQ